MTIEHWTDDESSTVFPRGDFDSHAGLFAGTPVKCCEIEGDDWEDCMKKYYIHMGWKPYIP